MLIAWWIGHPLGGFVMTVCLRIVIVLHSTFCVNSFAHTFGTKAYLPEQSACDNWLNALLTNGEGFHNFHHRFPVDYRNGMRWYHWDRRSGAFSRCPRSDSHGISRGRQITRSHRRARRSPRPSDAHSHGPT
jgi:fatty-acid desaturase